MSLAQAPAPPRSVPMTLLRTPAEGWDGMVQRAVDLSNGPTVMVFLHSLLAGIYLGFGGMMCTAVAGGLATAGVENPGLQTLAFGALFPVGLLIITQTGGVLSGLNVGATATYAARILVRKTSANFLQTFLKGIGCNWLVCIAIFMGIQAQDMAGKMVACWFPISAFVMSGFEHAPANMCLLPHGLLGGATHDLDIHDILVKNIIPASLGNLWAGAIMMALGYSPVVHRFLRTDFWALLTQRCKKQVAEEVDLEKDADAKALEAMKDVATPSTQASITIAG